MTRPTVLVASTHATMAYALSQKLKQPCRELGLRLEICSEGEGEEGLGVVAYSCAENLFDALEKRDPMELADTLVVLDLGAELADAFKPEGGRSSAWRPSKQARAGVAVELVMRFPQVFPVFLSPAVPVLDGEKFETGEGIWNGFSGLKTELLTTNKPSEQPMDTSTVGLVQSLFYPTNFATLLDGGKSLNSIVDRFANDMRCWFDPTGVRTVVKNQFLGKLFGSDSNWSNTAYKGENDRRRAALLGRLDRVAVAVDEEREFSLLSAYTAWKFGRRAWIVTTYAEFKQTGSSWRSETCKDRLILRDVDLRFPDLPLKGEVRHRLKMIDGWDLGEGWNDRKVTGETDPGEDGFQKPISTLYELKAVLGEKASKAPLTVAAQIGVADDLNDGSLTTKGPDASNHGAPYHNLAMAQSLLRQARRCADGAEENLIGALLASEAYELLLGMSKTTALEALQEMHRAEVRAEVSFPGIGHNLVIRERKNDVEASLDSLYQNLEIAKYRKAIFLSQFWADLRAIYRDGERFSASESANRQSLISSSHIPSWLIWVATSMRSLAAAAVITVISFSAVYACLDGYRFDPSVAGIREFTGHIVPSVLMTSLSLEPQGMVAGMLPSDKSPDAVLSGWAFLVPTVNVAISYGLFGIFISMLYRKIVRG